MFEELYERLFYVSGRGPKDLTVTLKGKSPDGYRGEIDYKGEIEVLLIEGEDTFLRYIIDKIIAINRAERKRIKDEITYTDLEL